MWWRGSAAAARCGRARCQSDCASLWCGAWYFNPGRRAHPGLLLVAHLGAERRGGGAGGGAAGRRGWPRGGGRAAAAACLNLLFGVLLGGERLAARLERALEEQLRAAELALLDVRARQVVQQLELRAVVAAPRLLGVRERRVRLPRAHERRERVHARLGAAALLALRHLEELGRARVLAEPEADLRRELRVPRDVEPRLVEQRERLRLAVELVQAVRVLELAPRRELAVRLHRLHRLRVPAQLDQRDQLAVECVTVVCCKR